MAAAVAEGFAGAEMAGAVVPPKGPNGRAMDMWKKTLSFIDKHKMRRRCASVEKSDFRFSLFWPEKH